MGTRSKRAAPLATTSCFAAAPVYFELAAVDEEVPVAEDPEDEVAGVVSVAALAKKAVKFC